MGSGVAEDGESFDGGVFEGLGDDGGDDGSGEVCEDGGLVGILLDDGAAGAVGGEEELVDEGALLAEGEVDHLSDEGFEGGEGARVDGEVDDEPDGFGGHGRARVVGGDGVVWRDGSGRGGGLTGR